MRFPLFTCALVLAGAAAAQSYEATTFEAPYVPLAEGVDAGAGPLWDDPEVTVPIGFDFPVYGAVINELTTFNLGDALIAPDGEGTYVGLWPLVLDVSDLAIANDSLSSTLQYATTGVAPERVFTFEWTNVGFYNEVDEGVSASTANWQVKLYESDGAIEFHFGPNTIVDVNLLSDGFMTSGLFSGVNLDDPTGLFYLATGDAAAPDFAEYTDFYTLYYGGTQLAGMPADGQVYRFGPVTNGIEGVEAEPVALYPNPADGGVVTVSVPGARVVDAQGREVLQLVGMERRFDVSGWPAGVYFVTHGERTARLLVH